MRRTEVSHVLPIIATFRMDGVDGAVAAVRRRGGPVLRDFSLFGEFADVASVMLRFLGIGEAGQLRASCKLALQLTRDYPWNDDSVAIVTLPLWKVCFPHARTAKLAVRRLARKAKLAGRSTRTYPDADFQHLRGVETVDMSGCDNGDVVLQQLGSVRTLALNRCRNVTGAGFHHLRGIRTLVLERCNGVTTLDGLAGTQLAVLMVRNCRRVTDASLNCHITVSRLNLGGCERVTGAWFRHLRGIHTLEMYNCRSVTSLAGLAGSGIDTLELSQCEGITDAALVHLAGIGVKSLSHCNGVTGSGLHHLRGIESLTMDNCDALTSLEGLAGFDLDTLNLWCCRGSCDDWLRHPAAVRIRALDLAESEGITGANGAFEHITGVQELDLAWCKNLTDAAFSSLRGIPSIDVSGCKKLTDAALAHLRGDGDSAVTATKSLRISCCKQITDAGIAHLRGIQNVDVNRCHQLTDACLEHLNGSIQSLNVTGCPGITAAAVGELGCSNDFFPGAAREFDDEADDYEEEIQRAGLVSLSS